MYRSALGVFENEEAEQRFIEALRRMTPDQKWQMAFAMWQRTVDVARARVARAHPNWTTAQVRAEVAQRIMELNGAAQVLEVRQKRLG
jgi:hypothetical protein